MSEYEIQRANMVDSQLRTNEVTDQRVLRAMMDIPREKFVPKDKRGLAYMDRDILVGRDKDGFDRYMMSPMTLARLVQFAGVNESDMVLIIGCTSGYAAALMATLAESVICVEHDEAIGDAAAVRLEEMACDNAATVTGSLKKGYSKEAPYDVVLINGCVEVIPQDLFAQLKEGGRLVAVQMTEENVGQAHLYRRIGDNIGEDRVSFDAITASLPGFQREQAFEF